MKKFRSKRKIKWGSLFGYIALAGCIVAGTCYTAGGVMDKLKNDANVREYNETSCIRLIDDCAHLEDKNQTVVITNQFTSGLREGGTAQVDFDLAVRGIYQGFSDFNDISKGVKFKLCTEDASLEQYGYEYKPYAEEKDVAINIKENTGNAAATTYHYLNYKGVLEKQSITYNKHILGGVWRDYGDLEKTLAPTNTYAYSITQHELGHLLGFVDLYDVPANKSIMYWQLNPYSKTYTDWDRQSIQTYNEIFMGVQKEPKVEEQKQQSNNVEIAPAVYEITITAYVDNNGREEEQIY